MPSLLPVLSVFQSTLPLRGATTYRQFHGRPYPISIHTPLAGSDRQILRSSTSCGISIHTPLAGSDRASSRFEVRRAYFNPHSPCGERLADSTPSKTSMTHFNPHSPCGERHDTVRHVDFINVISIHTPLAGSDALTRPTAACSYVISIHTPLAGSDIGIIRIRLQRLYISIHTPLAGSDYATRQANWANEFQSTLPLRGATQRLPRCDHIRRISIHTPLAGSDHATSTSKGNVQYFNPHSPCGERHDNNVFQGAISLFQSTPPLRGATRQPSNQPNEGKFQSTPPLRGATDFVTCAVAYLKISIHTPLAGSDTPPDPHVVPTMTFQSTPPLRGATRVLAPCRAVATISIHTPLAGSDSVRVAVRPAVGISIHTPLAGSDFAGF